LNTVGAIQLARGRDGVVASGYVLATDAALAMTGRNATHRGSYEVRHVGD
jgi:hypothetical protein